MTIEEKLAERLKAQGWDRAVINHRRAICVRDKPTAPRGLYAHEEHLLAWPSGTKLDAALATEIEAYFKEQLTK